MSRTETTTPAHARRELWHEHHDHRHGACTLPDLDDYLSTTWPVVVRHGCQWVLDWTTYRSTACSCELCSAQDAQRRAHRRDRQQTRVALRQGRWEDL